MQPGYICVAGIDPETGAHIRPVLWGRLPAALLARYGGPFDIAALVDLASVTQAGEPPEVEDRRFDRQRAHRLTTLSAAEFWRQLQRAAKPSLSDIFGSALRQQGRACVTQPGMGSASLGCLLPASPPTLSLDAQGKPRMDVTDGVFTVNLSVTDLRLYQGDHVTPDEAVIAWVAERIQAGVGVILSVGLTRPYPADNPKHWLQVNNIHLADDPVWRLG
jgi:hypothetical protein